MLQQFPVSKQPVEVCVLEGFHPILEHAPLLEQFAERCGQPVEMHGLAFFLHRNGADWKRRCLVLFLKPGTDRGALKADDILATAMFYELRKFGLGTGAFLTDAKEGTRTVIAPIDMRSEVAALAVETLMQRGARVVLTNYATSSPETEHAGPLLKRKNVLWAERSRIVKNGMQLGATYDETLAKLGKKTRSHMRYYRKRFLEKMACEFVEDVRSLMSEHEFATLNDLSLNPVLRSESRHRYESCAARGGFMIGLRGPEGQWLSVVGGWRQGTTTTILYQMNAAGYEKDSISTVMRSFLLETEVARGTQRLSFYGGTNHTMGHSFDDDVVHDLIVRRRSLTTFALRRVSHLLASRPEGSVTFFAKLLTSKHIEWRGYPKRRAISRSKSPQPMLVETFSEPAFAGSANGAGTSQNADS